MMKNNFMSVDLPTGLLETAQFCPTEHCDERPCGAIIDLIVIHSISLPPGEFGTSAIHDFFRGQLNPNAHPFFQSIADLKVSAHVLIDREGTVVQFVPFHLRAWHAGDSLFQGKVACNDFSIGVELEGTNETPYEKEQYHSLANVITLLMAAYPHITRDRIVGHADIAPERKTDPGRAFDWPYLQGLLL